MADMINSSSAHQPGRLDFTFAEKRVSVTELRRRPSVVWAYVEIPGHAVIITRRGKPDCVLMSLETHACMSGDYENTLRRFKEATDAWRTEQKEARKKKLMAKRAGAMGKDPVTAIGTEV